MSEFLSWIKSIILISFFSNMIAQSIDTSKESITKVIYLLGFLNPIYLLKFTFKLAMDAYNYILNNGLTWKTINLSEEDLVNLFDFIIIILFTYVTIELLGLFFIEYPKINEEVVKEIYNKKIKDEG